MDTYFTIEEKYLQAVDEATYGELPKGLQLLKEIIENDPFYARAHFQLGKIYYYKIGDYQTAGFHFKTCMEIEPSFPDVYFDYMALVVFLTMEKQVHLVAEKALTLPGVVAADIYDFLGLFYEKNKNWTKALAEYRRAYAEVTDNKLMEGINESISRVKGKVMLTKAFQYHLTE